MITIYQLFTNCVLLVKLILLINSKLFDILQNYNGLSFLENLLVFSIRNTIKLGFYLDLNHLRVLSCLAFQFVDKDVELVFDTVPSMYRLKSYLLVKDLIDKVSDYSDWNKRGRSDDETEDLSIEWLIPNNQKLTRDSKIFVYIHGGAFVLGKFSFYRGDISKIIKGSNCIGLGINYRLAPEYSAPCQIEDVLATLLYISHAKGIAFNQICIGGDSAGGNLSASINHLLRDLNLGKLAGTILISPYLNLMNNFKSQEENSSNDILGELPLVDLDIDQNLKIEGDFATRFLLKNCSKPIVDAILDRGHLYASKKFLKNPLISPVYDTNFDDLSPMLIIAGESERVMDDSIAYYLRITQAREKSSRIPRATLHIYEGMTHSFQQLFFYKPQAKLMFQRVANFLTTCFSDESTPVAKLSRNHPINLGFKGVTNYSSFMHSLNNDELYPITVEEPVILKI